MIARVWTARAERAKAPAYAQHLRNAVLPSVGELPGFLGAQLLERDLDDEVEIIVVTEWESLDHIRAFAGPDIDRAVVTPFAENLLTRFDTTVRHYRLTRED